ncbi:hypothetical protein BDK51DRAFT_28010, partial [Blyttiomyces helicus]
GSSHRAPTAGITVQPGQTVFVGNGTVSTTANGVQPLLFNLYRDQWRNFTVMAGDQVTPLYFLQIAPMSVNDKLDLALRRWSPTGPIVYLITKLPRTWDFITVDPANPSNIVNVTRGGALNPKFTFHGYDGKRYAWKPHISTTTPGNMDLICYDPVKKLVAQYARTQQRWIQEGVFLMYPGATHMQDLVISTGLTCLEWEVAMGL